MFIYSVAITHVAADCISFAATFYASHEMRKSAPQGALFLYQASSLKKI